MQEGLQAGAKQTPFPARMVVVVVVVVDDDVVKCGMWSFGDGLELWKAGGRGSFFSAPATHRKRLSRLFFFSSFSGGASRL